MWVTAVYHQVSMFSLRPATATSTGGRSLLVPTPFSIKMALLDAALRTYGLDIGSASFPIIRDSVIALSPPRQIITNNCFMRILKPFEEKGSKRKENSDDLENSEAGDSGRKKGLFIRNVAFRQYVYYNGPLGLSVQVYTQQNVDLVTRLLTQVNYLGKRGSLFQLDSLPMTLERLPTKQGYLRLDGEETRSNETEGYTLQMLDDCTSDLTFARANIFAEKSRETTITLGKERVLRHIVLPYRMTRSSRGFSLYERIP